MQCVVSPQEILAIIVTAIIILLDPKSSRWRCKGLKGTPQLLGSLRGPVPLVIDKQAVRGGEEVTISGCAPLSGAALKDSAR